MTEVADRLREARALIERGWTQGKFRKWTDDGVCYCADGAIDETFSYDEIKPYRATVGVFIRAIGVKEHAYIWEWNDAPERTQDEVLAAFDKAIELAERAA